MIFIGWDFFEKDSEEMYYFLGFVAADGYVSDNEIEIGINEKDIALLGEFRDLIVPEKPLYHKGKTNSYTLKISCKNRIDKIKKFFSMKTNKKCYEILFPKSIPNEFVKDFIRGYIDGDGCIDATKGYRKDKIYIGPRIRILGNEIFLTGMKDKIREFVPNNTNRVSPKGKENIFYLTYNFSIAKKILEWTYKNNKICLTRKYDKAKHFYDG